MRIAKQDVVLRARGNPPRRWTSLATGAVTVAFAVTLLASLTNGAGASSLRHDQAAHHHRPHRTASLKVSASPGRSLVLPSVAPGVGPPFSVESETLRLFDPSRTTPARGSVPASPGRVLVTDLFVPEGGANPVPLIVFAHGWNSNPTVYQSLLTRWAQAGFLVAAPVFPDSTDLYAGSPVSNYADQAVDISFVITSLLESKTLLVDPSRIAVAGHSDGGTDVALMALDPMYADPRVHAYLSLSGEMPSGVAPYTVVPSSAAFLVAVGSADEYGLYPKATEVFDNAQAASKAMVVEQGGDHLGSFVDDTATASAMRDETTRFLELALEPQVPTTAAVVEALETPEPPLLSVVSP